MSIFNKLMEKPWLAQPEGMDPSLLQPAATYWPARTALRFFLATVTVIFFLFIMTMLGRSQMGDFHALAGEPWLPFDRPVQLWWNTGILLLSSLAMQAGLWLARKGQLQASLLAVMLAVLFVLGFMGAQWYVWQQLALAGFGLATNPASSYFYLLTAVHLAHLFGGVVALAGLLQRYWQQQGSDKVVASLSLCTTYWHYLFVIWLVLFALLTSSANTIDSLAALCGF